MPRTLDLERSNKVVSQAEGDSTALTLEDASARQVTYEAFGYFRTDDYKDAVAERF